MNEKNNSLGTIDGCCLTSVNAVTDFHSEDPEVLFRNWDLEVWSLKAEDCLFKPLQDKETNTPACAYNSSWSDKFIYLFSFFLLCSVLLCSPVLLHLLLCYMMLHLIMMCHLCGLHWSACINQSQIGSALVTKCLPNIIKSKLSEIKHFAYQVHITVH